MKMIRRFMFMGIVLLLSALVTGEKIYAAEGGMITELSDKEDGFEDGLDTENTGQDISDKAESTEDEPDTENAGQNNMEESESTEDGLDTENAGQDNMEEFESTEDGSDTENAGQDISDKSDPPEDVSDIENTGQDISDKAEKEKIVNELDLGDYRAEMTVGEKQLLIVTTIPQVPDKELSFLSSNTEVAKINGLGRITALHAGQTEIMVMCDQVVQSFQLQVSETVEEKEEELPEVEHIEIGNYQEKMYVDDIQRLTVTWEPRDAVNAKTVFRSANEEILTVTSTGEIKALAKGDTEIKVQVGDIVETIPVSVRVKTKNIHVEEPVVFMHPGDTHMMKAEVVPAEAEQSLTWKSTDLTVAKVTEDGTVHAGSTGETSVIVSNGEVSNSIVVIVNEQYADEHEGENGFQETDYEWGRGTEARILGILEQSDIAEISVNQYPCVSKKMLRELYEKKKTLILTGDEYTVQITGSDIVNFENAFYCVLDIKNEEQGIYFTIEQNLPGRIKVALQRDEKYSYFFLFNEQKERYEKLKLYHSDEVEIDLPGTYLLSKTDRKSTRLNSSHP